MLRIMAEGWDASAPGVLRLPSGRLIRGRGLRLHVAEGSAPNFGLYLSNARPAPVAWQARWVLWPDSDCPATAVRLLTHYAKRGFELKMSVWRSPVRASWTDRNCPCLHRGAGRRTHRADGGLRAGALRRPRGRDAVAASVRGTILDGVTRPVGGSANSGGRRNDGCFWVKQ